MIEQSYTSIILKICGCLLLVRLLAMAFGLSFYVPLVDEALAGAGDVAHMFVAYIRKIFGPFFPV